MFFFFKTFYVEVFENTQRGSKYQSHSADEKPPFAAPDSLWNKGQIIKSREIKVLCVCDTAGMLQLQYSVSALVCAMRKPG